MFPQESHQPMNRSSGPVAPWARILFNKANKVQPVLLELVAPSRIFNGNSCSCSFSEQEFVFPEVKAPSKRCFSLAEFIS
jgi:hypothetical protein